MFTFLNKYIWIACKNKFDVCKKDEGEASTLNNTSDQLSHIMPSWAALSSYKRMMLIGMV